MLMDLGCVSNHSVGWSGWSYHWKCDLSPPALSCQAPGPLLACSPCVVSAYPNTRITPSSLAEMGDMESYKVMLNGPAPWGFRLQGGKDFSMPLSISRPGLRAGPVPGSSDEDGAGTGGRYLVALGHYYHPEEFICCQCRKVLDEGGFFEEKGSIFCPKCYDMRYAPSCAKCKKKITGEVMHALKMTWHVQCFTCAACKTPIRNRAFYMEEGQPYCERGRTRGPHMAPGTVGAQHLTVWVGGELPCAVGLSPGHGEGRDPAPVAPEPSVPVLCGCWVVPSLPRCHGDDGGCTSKTMRRCLAPSAAAATSRLTLGTGSWRRWGSAGTTLASSVRSARPTWKGRRSTPRRTSRSARATLSPTCEGREFSCAHACPWPCMLLSPSPAAPREPGWALTPSPCSCLFPDSSWPSSSRG
ncbi:PDZ and LIM domain protein 7 isoform 16-T18 [Alca torda]